MGNYEEALRLWLETWEIQKINLGPEDADTLMTAHNIGTGYRKLERYTDALRMEKETFVLRETTLGRDHPDTLICMWSIAHDLILLDRSPEALPLLDECLERSVGKRVHANFPDIADLRLRLFEKAGDASGCMATAEIGE